MIFVYFALLAWLGQTDSDNKKHNVDLNITAYHSKNPSDKCCNIRHIMQ